MVRTLTTNGDEDNQGVLGIKGWLEDTMIASVTILIWPLQPLPSPTLPKINISLALSTHPRHPILTVPLFIVWENTILLYTGSLNTLVIGCHYHIPIPMPSTLSLPLLPWHHSCFQHQDIQQWGLFFSLMFSLLWKLHQCLLTCFPHTTNILTATTMQGLFVSAHRTPTPLMIMLSIPSNNSCTCSAHCNGVWWKTSSFHTALVITEGELY